MQKPLGKVGGNTEKKTKPLFRYLRPPCVPFASPPHYSVWWYFWHSIPGKPDDPPGMTGTLGSKQLFWTYTLFTNVFDQSILSQQNVYRNHTIYAPNPLLFSFVGFNVDRLLSRKLNNTNVTECFRKLPVF